MIKFQVIGKPIPQPRPCPSARGGVYNPTKNGINGWKQRIILEAKKHIIGTIQGPVALELSFQIKRPKSHFGTGANGHKIKHSSPDYHTQTPQLFILVKAVMDALTQAKAWKDDSQVQVLNCSKWWVGYTQPGVKISITEA